jgi:hypothetical protein
MSSFSIGLRVSRYEAKTIGLVVYCGQHCPTVLAILDVHGQRRRAEVRQHVTEALRRLLNSL